MNEGSRIQHFKRDLIVIIIIITACFCCHAFEMLTNLDNKKTSWYIYVYILYSQSFEGDQALECASRDLLQFVVLQKPAAGRVQELAFHYAPTPFLGRHSPGIITNMRVQ